MLLPSLTLSRCLMPLGVAFLLFSNTACTGSGEVGSKGRPLTMFFVPSDDTHSIMNSASQVTSFLSRYMSQKLYGKDSGFYIKPSVPVSFIAVVEAFGSGRADFAALNTFSYVLVKDIKKYPSEAILNVLRGKGEGSYKAQILARADSKINSIEDLNGKRFAYVDPASTSGFVLPALLFEEKGIKPSQTVFANRHDNVVTMIYQGQVDAGATYYSTPEEVTKDGKTVTEIRDARSKVLTQFPDVEKKVKIIGFSREIPNAPWVLRANLYKDPAQYQNVKAALQDGVIEYAKSEEGKKVLMALYSITGMIKVSDDDFSEVRKLFVNSNMQLEEIMKKAK